MNIFISFLTITSFVLFFRKWLITKGIFDFQHLLFFSVAGFSPVITVMMLVSNYYIIRDYSATGYEVKKVEVYWDHNNLDQSYYYLTLKNNEFAKYAYIRTFPGELFTPSDNHKKWYLGVTVSRGLWGLENFEDKQVIIGNTVIKEK